MRPFPSNTFKATFVIVVAVTLLVVIIKLQFQTRVNEYSVLEYGNAAWMTTNSAVVVIIVV